MSAYVDALRSARPEHLYVFDVDQATLDGGAITDQGYGAVNGTVNEDAGFAELEPVESIVDGLTRSVKFNVLHDRGVNNDNLYFSRVDAAIGDKYFGSSVVDWCIEAVVYVPDYNRAREGFVTEIGGVFVHATMNSDAGISCKRVDNDTFIFAMTLNDSTTTQELFTGMTPLPTNAVYHVAVRKVNDRAALFVNGSLAAAEDITVTFEDTVSQISIGGAVSSKHGDLTVASVAFFDRASSPQAIKERYQTLEVKNDYFGAVYGLEPTITVMPDFEEPKLGTFEPELDKMSRGADSRELHENSNGELRIQPDQLGSGAVTFQKELSFDVSGLTAGISVFLDMVETSDADGGVSVEYSLDGTTYSAFPNGEDTIPELDANWGSAV